VLDEGAREGGRMTAGRSTGRGGVVPRAPLTQRWPSGMEVEGMKKDRAKKRLEVGGAMHVGEAGPG
jgi:hypothetical protein